MRYQDFIDLESITQSEFSPSTISNDEVVARVLFSPKHYDNGEIVAAAFVQIFSPNGMSVLRKEHSFETSLKVTIALLQKEDENKYFGYVCAKVSEIRAILYETFRVFYVLDTARKNNIGHADVFSIRIDEIGSKRWVNNFIRYEISQVFNQLVEHPNIDNAS